MPGAGPLPGDIMIQRIRPRYQATEALARRLSLVIEKDNINYKMEKGGVITLPSSSQDYPVDLAVYLDPAVNCPDFIAHVDAQACGRMEDFSGWIRECEGSGVKEFWLIYPRDRIVVVRTINGDGKYNKPDIYSDEDSIPVNLFKGMLITGKELFYGA